VLRERLHLSQEQVAERADLHWTYVSGIERGRRNPGLNTMGIATALGVSLSELVSNLREPSVTTRKSTSAPRKAR
jgi:transcriptional regulator with XRE-family HTH domain